MKKHDKEKFRSELKSLLNRYSMENGSNTPDFILAQYLWSCLRSYEAAVRSRENLCGREFKEGRIPLSEGNL
jgi:hypothetical protein